MSPNDTERRESATQSKNPLPTEHAASYSNCKPPAYWAITPCFALEDLAPDWDDV